MKKLLILILIGLLLILSIFAVVKGINLGKLEILGFNSIKQRSKELDDKIQEASKINEKDYKQAISTLEEDGKKLQQEKKKYDDMTQVSEESEVASANQMERYEVETLWVKLGNHATSEGVIMKMEILQGSSGAAGTYNLRFTVTGSYISIVDFVSDIENDSTLGFTIEEFKMVPTSSEANLEATFVCKDITIKDLSSASSPSPTSTSTTNNSNTNTTSNNKNTTNTSSNTNTNSTVTNTTTNSTNTTSNANNANLTR